MGNRSAPRDGEAMNEEFKITRLPGPGQWYAVTGRGYSWTRPHRTAKELATALEIIRAAASSHYTEELKQ